MAEKSPNTLRAASEPNNYRPLPFQLSAPMPSVLHFPNRQARATASVVLVLATVLVLIVEHVTVSVSVGEARTPEIVLVTASGASVRAAQAVAKAVPVSRAQIAPTSPTGPGGSQPWVRWSYIP